MLCRRDLPAHYILRAPGGSPLALLVGGNFTTAVIAGTFQVSVFLVVFPAHCALEKCSLKIMVRWFLSFCYIASSVVGSFLVTACKHSKFYFSVVVLLALDAPMCI